jgi:hypothetical protein
MSKIVWRNEAERFLFPGNVNIIIGLLYMSDVTFTNKNRNGETVIMSCTVHLPVMLLSLTKDINS